MKKISITKESLEDLLYKQKLSVNEIKQIYKCSKTCVLKYIKLHGLTLFPKERANYSGQKFNFLTIIQDNGLFCLCKCECGVSKTIRKNSVVKGGTKSCGCWKQKISSELGRKSKMVQDIQRNTEYRLIIHDYWYHYKINAINRKLEYKVTQDYLECVYINQNGKCALSGVDLTLPKTATENRKYKHTASLDRIDNSKGYVEGNIQFVHKELNNMKNKHTLEYFVNWCQKVIDYQLSLKLST